MDLPITPATHAQEAGDPLGVLNWVVLRHDAQRSRLEAVRGRSSAAQLRNARIKAREQKVAETTDRQLRLRPFLTMVGKNRLDVPAVCVAADSRKRVTPLTNGSPFALKTFY